MGNIIAGGLLPYGIMRVSRQRHPACCPRRTHAAGRRLDHRVRPLGLNLEKMSTIAIRSSPSGWIQAMAARVFRKRAREKMNRIEPIRARLMNCGQTTVKPAPR